MFRNEKFEIRVVTGQIYRLKIFEGAEIEGSDAQEMAVIFRKHAKGQHFAVLLDATSFFTISSEAKSLIASKEYTKDRIAAAFVTRSLANKIVGNFFIKFNKPATPTRLFSDESEALEWLKSIIKKDKNLSLVHAN